MPVTINTPGSVPWTMWASEKPSDGQLVVIAELLSNPSVGETFYVGVGVWPDDWGSTDESLIVMWMPMKDELLAMWKAIGKVAEEKTKVKGDTISDHVHTIPKTKTQYLDEFHYGGVPSYPVEYQGIPMKEKTLLVWYIGNLQVLKFELVGMIATSPQKLAIQPYVLGEKQNLYHLSVKGFKGHPDFITAKAHVSLEKNFTKGNYDLVVELALFDGHGPSYTPQEKMMYEVGIWHKDMDYALKAAGPATISEFDLALKQKFITVHG